MKRAIALSLMMILAIGLMLPLVPTEASNKGKSHYSSKRKKKIKKYSKAWWRRYRAQMRRKRALLARKKALQANQKMYAKANTTSTADTSKTSETSSSANGGYYRDSRGGWSVSMPSGWSSRPVSDGAEQTFKAYSNGRPTGSATISVVGASAPQFNEASSGRAMNKSLAGVPVANFRRLVIDKMIREEGWVVNDYVKEVGGKKVFVVVAQTPSSNGQPAQTKVFYFTESGGRILNLATSASVDVADKIAADSEKMLDSIHKNASSNSSSNSGATKPTASLNN